MRITPACSLLRLNSHHGRQIRRYAHAAIHDNKPIIKKQSKAAFTIRTKNASQSPGKEEKELTSRQLKRLQYWKKSTEKSAKDKAEHERKTRAQQIGGSQEETRAAVSAVEISKGFQRKMKQKQIALAVTIKRKSQAIQKQEAAYRRLTLERDHVSYRSRIRTVRSSRKRNNRLLEAQKWWLAKKFRSFRVHRISKASVGRVKDSSKAARHIKEYRQMRQKIWNMRAWVRKQVQLSPRKRYGLVVRRTLGIVRDKKEDIRPAVTGTVAKGDRWTPFMQRRRHQLASLESELDRFILLLKSEGPNSSIESNGTVHEQPEELRSRSENLQWRSPQSLPVPISVDRFENQLPHQSRLQDAQHRRSFSNMTPVLRRALVNQQTSSRFLHQATFTTSSRKSGRDVTAASLPISPLERKLARSKQRQTKRQPTRAELEELANNPWAIMLASSIRLDNSSRIRLPTDLLIDLGLITNPLDEQVYPMPTELADLKAFADRLKSGKRFTKVRPTNEIKGKRTRVSPYRLLLEEMSDSLQVWDQINEVSRSKTGAVMRRLIPPRWIQDNEKHETYQGVSRPYWEMREANDELDDDAFQRPEAPFDLRKIQWHTATAERILSMISQRVLIALDHYGNMLKARAGSLQVQSSGFDWPDDHVLILSGTTPDDAKREFWNDMGDIESEDAISGTGVRQGNAQDPRPPIAVRPSEIADTTPSQATLTAPVIEWLPGSFFLHVGPAEMTLKALPYIDSTAWSGSSMDIEFQESKYITPMINVAQGHRLPVFNLQAMLGPEFLKVSRYLLERHRDVFFDGLDTEKTTKPNVYNQLILCKAGGRKNQNGQLTLAHELWQLWRYVGGRDCLVASTTQQDLDKNVEESDFTFETRTEYARRSKNTSGYEGMSVAAWKHLYELLDIPPEESWSSEPATLPLAPEKKSSPM